MAIKKTLKQIAYKCIATSNVSSLGKLIQKYEVISFDVFDTLIKRNVRYPSDVFTIVENKATEKYGNGLLGFKKNRILAERNARICCVSEDVSLALIYEQLDYKEDIKFFLFQTELEVEYALVTPHKEMKDVFEYALSLGKTIILASDMYLERSFIEKLLRKCGFSGYEKLYVSSEIGLLKATGNLFKQILKENSFNPNTMLHIGDAIKADWFIPKLLGIHSVCIKTYSNHTLYGKGMSEKGIDCNMLYSFINNTVVSDNHYFQIGYENLGPILYGFCLWLHEYKQRLGIEKLLFFSRDGQLIYKCYQKLFPKEDINYVYLSRRSLTVPLFHLYNLEDIIDIFWGERGVSMRNVIVKLGLEFDDTILRIIQKYGFDEDSYLAKDDLIQNRSFIALMQKLKPLIDENSRNEFIGLKKYLNELDLTGKVGFVDIGWKGRIQMSFEKLLPFLNMKFDFVGFYMGILRQASNYKGYIYSPVDSEMKLPMKSFGGLFETLFSADHGSVKRYATDGGVDFYRFEYEKRKEVYIDIVKLQSGAISFVEAISGLKDFSSLIQWDSKIVVYPMLQFGINTKKRDLSKIGAWPFFTNETYKYLARPSFMARISFKVLKKEFSAAPWKIAYLRRYLLLPLPYYKLFKMIRRRVVQD